MKIAIGITVTAAVLSLMLLVSPLAGVSSSTHIRLHSGPFAPESIGQLVFRIDSGVLSGHASTEDLPAQGAHAFYVLWFVRTDTGDKVFLGPIINEDQSILFLSESDGRMSFRAAAYTTGPHSGSPIALGAHGDNFFVLIAENQIDTSVPHPVSAPPASFALMATF
jgi:hypothetical protein